MISSSEITEHTVDIEDLFAKKNPWLFKILPGFIFTYLKKTIHQDMINDYIYQNRFLFGHDWVDKFLKDFDVKSETYIVKKDIPGETQSITSVNHQKPSEVNNSLKDIISSEGRYIFAANHPIGSMDGMALIHEIGKARKDIIFPVNDLLMSLPGMQPLFIPINKHGSNTENILLIDQTFSSGKAILYFPAGLVSRKQKGGMIKDLEWKKTFISKAKKYKRDIIPVYIKGRNSDFFYTLSRWRTKLGIKANIEMLYLVDEMVKQKGKTITMIFGQPIPYTTFDRSKTNVQWAEFVREKVYAMSE